MVEGGAAGLPAWKGLSFVNTLAVAGVRLKKSSSDSCLTAGVVRKFLPSVDGVSW